MRDIIALVLAIAILTLPLSLFASEDKQTPTDAQRAFVEEYVKAINEKDESQLKQLMHPESRKCLNSLNEVYYHDQFQALFFFNIPENYVAEIKELSDTDKAYFKQQNQIGPKIGYHYPVNWTHRLDISYYTDSTLAHGRGFIRFLVKEGDNFYEVYGCPTSEFVAEYRKIKNDQKTEYFKKEKALLEDYQRSLPLSEKRSFLSDEYGVLYWESKEDWFYNWRFKTKNKLKSIEIIFVDQDGKQEVLVDNKTMNGYFSLEFGFRLSDPGPMGNLANPDLSIPFGYSRMGDHPMGISNWEKLEGNKLENVVYNKNSSNEDQFNKSGEIILATYKTADDAREFTSTIKIKYEIQEE